MSDPAVEEQVSGIDAILVPLVNFHARVMDYCMGAAQAIVREKLVEQSSIVQGPDPGPGAGEHPMTGVMAVAMYREVVEDMRKAEKKLKGESGAENPQT